MNPISYILIEVASTFIVVTAVLFYLRPFLQKLLADICGTDDRARFWATFTNIALTSLPLVSALGFVPAAETSSQMAVETINQLQSNLIAFIWGLAFIGFILLFFSAIASRSQRAKNNGAEAK